MNTDTSSYQPWGHGARPVPQCRRPLLWVACWVSDLEPLELNEPVTHQEGVGKPFFMVNDESKILIYSLREEDQ